MYDRYVGPRWVIRTKWCQVRANNLYPVPFLISKCYYDVSDSYFKHVMMLGFVLTSLVSFTTRFDSINRH